MADPVLIRGWGATRWHSVLRAVSAMFLVTAILFIRPKEETAASFMVVVGLTIFLANEVAAFLNVRRRRWITDTGSGFMITDRLGNRVIDDDQVTDVQLKQREKFSSGVLRSMQRGFSVRVRGERQAIEMNNRFPVSQPDPLAGLIQRTIDGLRQRWATCLQEGEKVVGDGWVLQADMLTVSTRSQARVVPFDELTLAGIFDGAVCVWREGEEEALMRLSPESRNAPVLYAWLLEIAERNRQKREVTGMQGTSGPESPCAVGSGRMGRVLFQRRSNPMRWALGAVGLILGALGAVIAAKGAGLGGMIVGSLGLLAIAAFFCLPPGVLQCCEQGVRWWSFTGWKEIRFDEVQVFDYRATRVFIKGFYHVTEVTLRFRSATKRIVYSTSLHNQDRDMEWLRDRVSRIVAARLGQDLATGRAVRWTPRLAFRGTDLWYRPAGFSRERKLQSFPLNRVSGFQINRGTFFLFSRDSERSVLTEDVSEPNFFPGLHLLTSLLSQSAPTDSVVKTT